MTNIGKKTTFMGSFVAPNQRNYLTKQIGAGLDQKLGQTKRFF